MIDRDKIKSKVLDCLVDKYDINPIIAFKMIKESVFSQMLEDEPDFVAHYGAEYWAYDIIDDEKYKESLKTKKVKLTEEEIAEDMKEFEAWQKNSLNVWNRQIKGENKK